MTAVRLLRELEELDQAVDVIRAVWGAAGGGLVPVELLRAYAHAGDPVLGAFAADADRVVGVCIAFLAMDKPDDLHLHSHMTAVLPGVRSRGVGIALKTAQRDWCLERGVDEVRWTVDPLLAPNARFNIVKLGATAHVYLPSFYGAMDDELNRGEETDRLEMSWRVRSPRVVAALSGTPTAEGSAEPERTVAIPEDYLSLRREDPAEAGRRRADVRRQLTDAFAAGLEITGYTPEAGYQLTRRG